jgi:hypothetical protein
VACESLLDRWNEGRNVVGFRHLSSTREGYDIFGKSWQLRDHLRSPALDHSPAAAMTGVVVKIRIPLDRSIGQE